MGLVIGVIHRFGCCQQLDPTAEPSMTAQLHHLVGHDRGRPPPGFGESPWRQDEELIRYCGNRVVIAQSFRCSMSGKLSQS